MVWSVTEVDGDAADLLVLMYVGLLGVLHQVDQHNHEQCS